MLETFRRLCIAKVLLTFFLCFISIYFLTYPSCSLVQEGKERETTGEYKQSKETSGSFSDTRKVF